MIVNEESAARSSVKTVAWNELQMSAAETLRVAGDRLPGLPDTTQLGVTGDHPVVIYFSSGTTGPQKAVMLSHRNIHAQFVISWSATFQLAFSFGCCLIDIVFLSFFRFKQVPPKETFMYPQ